MASDPAIISKEQLKPTSQSAAAAEWHIYDRDRLVVAYEFASRTWSGHVEPYDDLTGSYGERRDLSAAQIEMVRRFFELVLRDGSAVPRRRTGA